MSHLVVDSCCTTYIVSLSYLGAENQNILMERHAANVLHGAPVVFGDSDLIVLTEWVGKTESLLEVCKPLLGDFEDIFGINVLKE